MGCGSKRVAFDNIDMEQWRTDRRACDGVRKQFKDAFLAQKDRLLALSEADIVANLGNPDRQELYKRNQKFYYYYLEPAHDCTAVDSTARPLRLAIRFNAMGLAKEVRAEDSYSHNP